MLSRVISTETLLFHIYINPPRASRAHASDPLRSLARPHPTQFIDAYDTLQHRRPDAQAHATPRHSGSASARQLSALT